MRILRKLISLAMLLVATFSVITFASTGNESPFLEENKPRTICPAAATDCAEIGTETNSPGKS